MRTLRLKRGEDRRLRAGHLWIFSNEVDTRATPLTDFAPGEEVVVSDFRGGVLGSACLNPHSLICARIYARDIRPLDAALVRDRLARALQLREGLFADPWYRLAYGEGDFLPGLVIDRFGDHLTIQVTTLAMEQRKDLIREALHELVAPKTLLWDNSVATRSLEGLGTGKECEGNVPEELEVQENGARFLVPCLEGQKTGWFFDQRNNRSRTARLCRDRDVLDAFSYVGGFGVLAGMAQARSVVFADASARALDLAARNMARNAAHVACETAPGDAFDTLKAFQEQGRSFDVVCIDPPAFIKRRKDHREGLAAYHRLNGLALSLVRDGGHLVTSSCSHALHVDELRSAVALACAKQGLHPRLVWQGFQGEDHPMHCSMPETAYLKCLIVQITRLERPQRRNRRPEQAEQDQA